MVYYHIQTQAKARNTSNYAISGLAPCGSTPPCFLRFDIAYFDIFAYLQILDFFDFFRSPSNHLPSFLSLTYFSIGHRSSLATHYPINRCLYSQLCDRCRPSLSLVSDFWRRNLGIPRTPQLHLCNQQPTNAGYAASYRLMV